jgi:uncharacterized membrane protein YhfC
MAVSAVLSIGAPVALFLALRKRFALRAIPLLVGGGMFVAFALILENALHALVLRPAADGTIALRSNPLLFMLYGSFAAGIFEETARFLAFRLMKNKYGGLGAGLAYGIGHGGIEAVLLAGLPMISNIAASVLANTGEYERLGDPAQLSELFAALAGTDSWLFLAGGLERIPAIAIQMSLSLLVWISVNKPGRWRLYPIAIALHAIVDMPAALLQTGASGSVALVEALAAVCAAALVVLAIRACRATGAADDAGASGQEGAAGRAK